MRQDRPGYDEKLATILRAAAAVFAEKGYHQASIRDISRATGVSLSGLYYYVRSKEELLFLIQDHCFGAVLENLERILGETEDPRVRLRLLVENHVRFFASNMQEMKVLSHEADSLSGEFRRRVNAKKKRYTDLCMGILQELRPAGSRIDLRVATFGLFGMLNWIYNWYHPGRDVPVEELADGFCRLFLQGYLAAGSDSTGAALPAGAVEAMTAGHGPSIWRR